MAHARADVIYSTFGPGNSYDNTTGQSLRYGDIGGHILDRGVSVSFVPATTEQLGQVLIAVEAPDAPFTVSMAADENFAFLGGTDGAGIPLETFNLTGDSAPQFLTLSSVLHPVLTAGTKYWVEIQASPAWEDTTDMGTWFNNNQGISGEVSTYDIFCSFLCGPDTGSATAPAVEVTSFEAAAPEPRMFVLIVVAALAIAFVKQKRLIFEARPSGDQA